VKLFGTTAAVFCITLMGTMLVPGARADEWNKRTVVTFSNAVEIPAVHLKGWGVLPPGTYLFKLLDAPGDRHVVQISNKEETIVYATILAIPNYRLTPTDKTVITFNEGIRDRPEALRAWFYPGATWGEEFVYPKAKAVELASVTKTPVLALKAEVEVEVEKPAEPAVVIALQQAPVVAVRPSGEEMEVAQVVAAVPQPAVVVAADPPAATLPATGSSLPLIGLFGILALSGGLALRFLRKGMPVRS
jgi:hypothetical protein